MSHGTALIKDTIPAGTTFVPQSIKVNGEPNQSATQDDLENKGITVTVQPGNQATVSFDVVVNDLQDKENIENTANLQDTTVSNRKTDKTSNKDTLEYVEPIITQEKGIETERQQEKVINGEIIRYTINIINSGGLEKEVSVKDNIPEGTTFIEGSIKINGEAATKEDGTPYTKQDLAQGIPVVVPEYTEDTNLSFEVTVDDLEDKAIISNIAKVDETDTNKIDIEYVEPIITQEKGIETERQQEKVINGEIIRYTINIINSGGLEKEVSVVDNIPEGTTFIEGSIKINGEAATKENGIPYTMQDLVQGIPVVVPEYTDNTNLSFEVTVNDLEDKAIISNIAKVDEVETNKIDIEYIEPVISQQKSIETERQQEKVINGEIMKYTIDIINSGGLEKEVSVVDNIPEGTTFVEGSIKINDEIAKKEDDTFYTEEDLEKGILIKIPEYTENNKLSFEVTVNDLEDKDIINNIAKVDEVETNKIDVEYIEPVISQEKTIKTEKERKYVINNEKMTYIINIINSGGLEKEVSVVDNIPEGTTFVEGSIKINDEIAKKEDDTFYTEEDLEKGILIKIPEYTDNTNLSFEVTSNDLEDGTMISNIAKVDEVETNKVDIEYVEPVISEQKAAKTQYEKGFAVAKEKVTFTIKVQNDGKLEKNVVIKDKVPEHTTFVEKSIKINDEPYEEYTEEDLLEGIEVLVPKRNTGEQENSEQQEEKQDEAKQDDTEQENPDETKQDDTEKENLDETKQDDTEKENLDEIKQDDTEQENNGETIEPGITTLSFDVIVNILKNDTDIIPITNIATVDGEETNEVKIEARPFNMKIDTEVASMTLNSKNQNVNDGKLAKIDIHRKEISTAQATVTYNVTVTNAAKVEGSAEVKYYIPQGLKVSSTNPSYWNAQSSNELTTTTNELQPGESQELEVQLTWENGESNFGQKTNKVEIIGTNNYSEEALETTTEDNMSDASVIFSINTGMSKRQKQIILAVLGAMILVSIEIYFIKKYVLR